MVSLAESELIERMKKEHKEIFELCIKNIPIENCGCPKCGPNGIIYDEANNWTSKCVVCGYQMCPGCGNELIDGHCELCNTCTTTYSIDYPLVKEVYKK